MEVGAVGPEEEMKTLKGTLTVNCGSEGTRFFSAAGKAGKILIDVFDIQADGKIESKLMRGVKTGEVLDVTITVKRRGK